MIIAGNWQKESKDQIQVMTDPMTDESQIPIRQSSLGSHPWHRGWTGWSDKLNTRDAISAWNFIRSSRKTSKFSGEAHDQSTLFGFSILWCWLSQKTVSIFFCQEIVLSTYCTNILQIKKISENKMHFSLQKDGSSRFRKQKTAFTKSFGFFIQDDWRMFWSGHWTWAAKKKLSLLKSKLWQATKTKAKRKPIHSIRKPIYSYSFKNEAWNDDKPLVQHEKEMSSQNFQKLHRHEQPESEPQFDDSDCFYCRIILFCSR